MNIKIYLKAISGISTFLFMYSCNTMNSNDSYHQGDPVILKKEYSLIPGICMYTYEGYGRKETFEDKCDKYFVGDQLGNSLKVLEKDTLNTQEQ